MDASYLLVAGARVVREAFAADHADDSDRPMCVEALGLPRLLVVDDVQDTTLAGMRFLEELGNAGVKLVLVGNPDESVQTFRGSYPEYLMRRAVEGRLKAKEEQLVGGSAVADQSHMTMADVIASRISLSIPSPEDEPLPPAERPGKLTAILGGVCTDPHVRSWMMWSGASSGRILTGIFGGTTWRSSPTTMPPCGCSANDCAEMVYRCGIRRSPVL